MTNSPLGYRLLIIAAAALFSTGGAAIKVASLSGWQIASFRSGIAALFLLAVIPESRRRWSWRMLPVAVSYAATLVRFVLANRLTTAANAIFLQSAAPIPLAAARPNSSRAEGNHCLDPNRIQDFLESNNRDRLIVALLIPTDHLLAHAQSPGQFRL